MLSGAHAHEAIAAGIAVAATLIAFRRSAGAALGVLLACLIASNSSILWLKSPFLTARWVALVTLALLLLPGLRRSSAAALSRVALLTILPAVFLLSATWSVEPRLTVERAVSFGIMLWVVAACGLRWSRNAREFDEFADALVALALAVLVFSVVAGFVTTRSVLQNQFRGVFENPNGLGLFLGLTYPFVAGALERRRLISLEALYLAASIAVASLAHSRSGLVVLVLVGVGFELCRRRQWLRVAATAIGAVAVASFSLAFAGSVISTSAPTSAAQPTAPSGSRGGTSDNKGGAGSTGTTTTPVTQPQVVPQERLSLRITGARTEAWSATIRFVKSKPLLGYGFGTGDRIFALYPKRVHFLYFVGSTPNQAYLQAALELGVLGLVIVLPLLWAAGFGIRMLIAGRSLNGASCALGVIAGLAAGFVESVFTSPGAPWAVLIWASAAGCVVFAQTDKSTNHDEPRDVGSHFYDVKKNLLEPLGLN